ncbi:MAG: hypothetical protein NTU49_04415 [Gammaproteobacteria bacterium]|nr:hypothetical protein [Gammaproteobacteria bacterium]
MSENKKFLSENSDLFNQIREFYQHEKYKETPERDIDAALYDIGFPTPQEEKLFLKFHQAEANKKSAIASQFPNETRKMQSVRIMGRHFPDQLSVENKAIFDAYLQAIYDEKETIPIDFRGDKKLTVSQALIEIAELQKSDTLDLEQIKLLADLKKYFSKVRN